MKSFGKICVIVALVCIIGGGVLIAVAFSGGGKKVVYGAQRENYGGYEYEDTVTDVTSLNLNMSAGTVQIIEKGDTFHVEASDMGENRFSSQVEDGCWIIKAQGESEEPHSFWEFPLMFTAWTNAYNPKIVITVPVGTVFEDVELSLDAGELTAKKLSCDNFTCLLDAGECDIDTLMVTDETEITVSAGSLEVAFFTTDSAVIKCDVGSVSIDGDIKGDAKINCSVGSIDLKLTDDVDTYNIDMSCDIGTIRLDGKRMSGFDTQKVIDNNADRTLEIGCDVGEIIIK